jgi:N-acetyl-anhydromuramyl-L-alanine amidase AmpD
MSNSTLVNFVKLSPNYNKRTKKINKITIHHVAGNLSVETLGYVFANPECEASANYGIDTDGVVGMYVEEKNRAWTSSSAWNDNQAVTIEVANDGEAPDWHVNDKALNKLVELCVDICKRNDIKKLNYTYDANGNLTRHNMFSNTCCPGPYLQSKFPWIAEQVNKKLSAKKSITEIAQEVIQGKWGNGTDRKNKLTSAGYDYAAVQSVVNRLLSEEPMPTIDEIAIEVIHGKWGNGDDRKKRLAAAGYDYDTVQKKVNELL